MGKVIPMTENDDDQEGNNLPTKEELLTHIRDYKLMKADMDEAKGKIGALAKTGEDQKNIHRKAFKLAAQCENMEDTKYSAFITHLLTYLGMLGLSPHPDLFADETAKDLARIAQNDVEELEELEEEEDELEEA